MSNARKSQILYLPRNQWSPRYDSTFYSLKLEGSPQYLTTNPPSSSSSSSSSPTSSMLMLGGKTNLPAYYFEVVVYREHTKTTLLRRYSQFRWLYDQLVQREYQSQTTEPPRPPLHIPPKTCSLFPLPCGQKNDGEALAKERMEGLEEFLNDALCRPGLANDPAVLSFLEIEN